MINFKHMAVYSLIAILSACGGGDGGGGSNDSVVTPSAQIDSAGGVLCGVDVGPNILQGTVTGVHDGDTITLNASGTEYKIRLDSIDAPELAQPFGGESQVSLSGLVLGKTVQVAYTKTDLYGRIVGSVFTDSCQYANLSQVTSGMAWFYKAYQCDVSASVRAQFDQAQSSATSAMSGLWSQSGAVAPWVYRNGSNPVAPTCSDGVAPPVVVPVVPPVAITPAPAVTVPSSTTSYTPTNACFKVWVNGYTKANGTRVSGYYRNSPACP